MITIGRGHKTPALSHLEPMFFHQPHDFLVVDYKALIVELRRHPAIAVQSELGTNLMHTFDKPGFILLALPLALMTAIATISFGFPSAIISCLLGAAAWMGSAILLFDQNFALPLLIPLGAGLATFVLVLGLRFVFLDKNARFLRKAFSSYVAPALVDQLVKNPNQLKLSGERREMTFLFTDLAGFTSLVEKPDITQIIFKLEPIVGGLSHRWK